MRMRLSATTARMAWSRASSHFSLLSFSTCCSFCRKWPSPSASSASFRNSPTAPAQGHEMSTNWKDTKHLMSPQRLLPSIGTWLQPENASTRGFLIRPAVVGCEA